MDLMFRDQSKEVACKAQGIKPKAKLKASASVDNAAPDCSRASRRNRDSDTPAGSESLSTWWSNVQVSAEQQAVCFFFSNYVLEPSESSKSVYDCLPALYNNESEKSAMSCAVTALGLAGLSYRRGGPCMLSAAKSMYSSALHLTNEALRDPKTAVADATLISVLLLGLYETNTCSAPPSMRAWLKHIGGATALLELRGKQQFNTEIGRRLFAHVRTQIVHFCILRRMPVPSTILELSAVYHGTSEDEHIDPTTKINATSAQLCNLRARIASIPSGSAAESAGSIISEVLSIAAKLGDWQSDLPLNYFPVSTVRIWNPTPEVYSDYYHIYRDQWAATFMNNCRVVLILLHEIIITQLSYIRHPPPEDFNEQSGYSCTPSPSYAAQIQRRIKSSQKAILDLIDQICASVPFLLDYEYCASASPGQSEIPHPRAVGGNAVMWSLFVAGEADCVRNSTRTWIIGRLNKIRTEMGVKQANTMAKLLLLRKEVTDVFVEDNATIEDRSSID